MVSPVVDSALTPMSMSIQVSEQVLEDLRLRLGRTRWPLDLGNADWSYGANAEYLRDFCGYWANEFDWSRQAAAINAYSHFRVTIDDLPIHYLHVPSGDPDAIPILLLHGWPWTFWDFRRLIERLTRSVDGAPTFEIVAPSLPGFVFSTPLPRTGISTFDTADVLAKLMTQVIGHQRFAVHASDFGGIVAAQLGHKYSESVIAIHSTAPGTPDFFTGERPWDPIGPPPSEAPSAFREAVLKWQAATAAHLTVHMLDPQSLSYGPHDSPVALAAWVLNRRYHYSDCRGHLENSFDRDELCTLLTLYWASECFVTSVRYYREAALSHWQPSHRDTPTVKVPTGVTHFTADPTATLVSEEFVSLIYNLVYFRSRETGGHFAAAESPDAVDEDIRATLEMATTVDD
jgi:pimeloyl-ACP methyl ester carboxylesterase